MHIERLGKVPMPKGKSHQTGVPAALRQLAVEEAIAVDLKQAQASQSALSVSKRTGMKFTTRKLEDGRVGIWRIA